VAGREDGPTLGAKQWPADSGRIGARRLGQASDRGDRPPLLYVAHVAVALWNIMAKPTPKNPQIAALTAAAQRVIDIFPQQMCPLEDLALAVANLEHVLQRGRGRQVKDQSRVDLIRDMSGRGLTVSQIVAETQIPESTVRRWYGRPAT